MTAALSPKVRAQAAQMELPSGKRKPGWRATQAEVLALEREVMTLRAALTDSQVAVTNLRDQLRALGIEPRA